MGDRTIARIAGVLFIIATGAALLGSAFLPALSAVTPSDASTDVARATVGVLCLLIGFFASAAIAASLYPVLVRTDPGLAIGSVVFRTIEAVMYLAGAVLLLSVLSIAGHPAPAAAADLASLAVLRDGLLSLREHTAQVAVLAFAVGGSLYYVAFLRTRLVPRWLSGWGLVAMAPLATAAVLAIFADQPVTGYALLALPIFFQELVLGGWLIVRGFAGEATVRRTPADARSIVGAPAGS